MGFKYSWRILFGLMEKSNTFMYPITWAQKHYPHTTTRCHTMQIVEENKKETKILGLFPRNARSSVTGTLRNTWTTRLFLDCGFNFIWVYSCSIDGTICAKLRWNIINSRVELRNLFGEYLSRPLSNTVIIDLISDILRLVYEAETEEEIAVFLG